MSKDQKTTKNQNVENVDNFKNEEKNNECIDCKFFIPGNYFSSECMICDNGSKFIKKECKTFQI